MKTTAIQWTLGGCCAGLLLVVAWQSAQLSRRPVLPPSQQTVDTTTPTTATAARSSSSAPSPNSAPTDPSNDLVLPTQPANRTDESPKPVFDWRNVESPDYRTYVENLRRIGVPEQTLRDIVVADVSQSLSSDRVDLLRRFLPEEFWRTVPDAIAVDLVESKRGLDQRAGAILAELLGNDQAPPILSAEWRRAETELRLDFLEPERRAAVVQTLELFDALERQIQQTSEGRPPTHDEGQLAMLMEGYEKRRQALSSLLAPAELAELDLRLSWTAENLRRAMARFDPSENEYRAIFNAWRSHDLDLAVRYATGQPDPGNDHVFVEISEALGEERFRLYRDTWWR